MRDLKAEVARRPPDKRYALLQATDLRDMSGLWLGSQEGHADAVKAFAALLKLIPEHQRAELVAATTAKGTPGRAEVRFTIQDYAKNIKVNVP